MSERQIMHEIQVGLCEMGARLLRNNVGLFETADGRKIKTGLGVGSADLIGWHEPTGRFLAVEVKDIKGRVTKEQACFIDAVNRGGGIAFVARSIEEAKFKLAEKL